MINKEGILKYIQEKGKSVSLQEIENIINNSNREEIKETQSKRFKYEIWDKKSDINGVSAKDIIDSRNYTIGQAYLIYIDDVLVYFQDHNPNETGYVKMTKLQAEELAKKIVNEKIEEYTDEIIASNVISTILSK
ncbi:MAG: hypothetical protein ACLTPN_01165 [Clostridia bacterium]